MKNTLFVLSFFTLTASAQTDFDQHFTRGSLRVDFLLAGNDSTTIAYFQSLKWEPWYGGSLKNLIDTFEYGSSFFKVLSAETGETIYSRGFSTLFKEWKTTAESRIISRVFYQTVTFPFPRNPVIFELYERDEKQVFNKILNMKIDPRDNFIQPGSVEEYETVGILKSGDPSNNVDIVFLPEGYTRNEMGKFVNDVRVLTDSLFTVSPFREYKDRFNISAVLAPSKESGTDNPADHIWRNTVMNSTFYTFNLERYLMTLDYWKVRDLASLVPYDQIYILVNTSKFGGGAVYNYYSLTSVDQPFSRYVLLHEFGHGFAGLADEYFDSEVSYENYYPLDVEPWEPNITTMVDFSKKWKKSVLPGTPVPTPPGTEFINSVGVFEGGGYVPKGVYRPQINCLMRGNRSDKFCFVCEKSIENMIHWIID